MPVQMAKSNVTILKPAYNSASQAHPTLCMAISYDEP